MTLKLSKRSNIPNFKALDILRMVNERCADGEDIIHLEAGQPCFGAPEPVLEYARQMTINDPKQGYTEAMGMSLLRDRIALYYKNNYNIDVDYKNIAITVGASGAFILTFISAFDAGDKVALATPGYPAYRNILSSLNIKTIEIETDETTNYQPYVSLLEKLDTKIDGLIIASPSNPTGTIIPDDELEKIVNWCDKNKVRIISDELYQMVSYGTKPQTIMKYTDKAIVINSFSKYFALTGWRLGWTVLPEDITLRVKSLSESLFVSPPTISQHLAYKIFDHMDILDEYVSVYKNNLDILRKELPKAGINKLSNTQGAFYIYADISNLTNNSEEFCKRMIDEAGVACTPGLDFDLGRGQKTIRISFAGTTEDIEKACERLIKWQK